MTSYRALASEVGCLSAEIYKEIRRCLRLRGGVVVDGVKWIWKTSEELAERLGVNEKTIRRHLKALVQMGWLKREQHQKRWGMRAYHYTLGDHAPLRAGVIAVPVEHLHGMQGVRSLGTQQMSRSVTAPADPIATGSVPQEQRDDGIKQLPSKRSVSPASAEMPLQSGRSAPSEPDILSASINRNTTSKNSPTGQNSLNSQGASRQTEKLPTGGDGTRGTKRSSLYAASPLVPETGASKAAPVRADWPDTTGISEGLLRVCIENARNLAFPGYIGGSQSFRIAS